MGCENARQKCVLSYKILDMLQFAFFLKVYFKTSLYGISAFLILYVIAPKRRPFLKSQVSAESGSVC